MKVVTEIETVDDQYCFCLRLAGRDVVLFAFRTEKEARIASDAMCQIAEHAVEILPAAEADTGGQIAAAETADADNAAQSSATADTGSPGAVVTSPFLGR